MRKWVAAMTSTETGESTESYSVAAEDLDNSTGHASGGFIDPAEVEKSWLSSPEYPRYCKQRTMGTNVLRTSVPVFVVSILLALALNSVSDPASIIAGIAAFLAVYAALIGYAMRRNAFLMKRRYIEREEHVYRALSLRRAAAKVEDTLSLANLFVFNRTLMNEYHSITKGQSEKSFRYSQIASFVGLFVLVSGASVAVVPVPALTKIAVAGLAAIGTAISGFISRTFLRSHELAISQLNNFFRQPLVSNYLLMAERLANNLPSEAKGVANLKIIDRIIESASSAERQGLSTVKTSKQRVRQSKPATNGDARSVKPLAAAEEQ